MRLEHGKVAEERGKIVMTSRRYRDLMTLRELLADAPSWQLAPAHWRTATESVDDLAKTLADPEQGTIERAIERAIGRLGGLEGSLRSAPSVNDPRRTNAPPEFLARIAEVVPRIIEIQDATAKPREKTRNGKDAH